MSWQRTVTQIDAKARRPPAGLVARGLLVSRGEERQGVHDEPARKEWAVARSGRRTLVSGTKPPDSARSAPGSRNSKDKKGRP